MNVQSPNSSRNLSFEIMENRASAFVIFLPAVLAANQWMHIAAVSGSNGMKLYLDGELRGTNGYRGSIASIKSGKTNYLGRSNWAAGQPGDDFQGLMDEVRVWKVERTPQQIATNMFRKLTGREP